MMEGGVTSLEALVSESNGKCLQKKGCYCSACAHQMNPSEKIIASDLHLSNDLAKFLKILPINFPIWIVNTIITHKKQPNQIDYQLHYYSNGNHPQNINKIHYQMLKSIAGITATNIQIYYQFHSKLMPKYQYTSVNNYTKKSPNNTSHAKEKQKAKDKGKQKEKEIGKQKQKIKQKQENEVSYIQPYDPQPIIRLEFKKDETLAGLDEILHEYLEKEQARFSLQNFTVNEQFLQWVYNQYNQNIFCMYLTQFYSQLYYFHTKNVILKGIFFYIIEPLEEYKVKSHILHSGRKKNEISPKDAYNSIQNYSKPKKLRFKPKLLNIKSLEIKFHEIYYSFQDEYKELILKGIRETPKKIAFVKQTAYRGRLQRFKDKVRDMYNEQQDKVLLKVQEEKQYEFQHDTNAMAKLLIPNMGEYKNLRQILNSEEAFTKVFPAYNSKKVFPSFNSNQPISQNHRETRTLKVVLSKKSSTTQKQKQQRIPSLLQNKLKKRYERILTAPDSFSQSKTIFT